jgi:hypothetical protein
MREIGSEVEGIEMLMLQIHKKLLNIKKAIKPPEPVEVREKVAKKNKYYEQFRDFIYSTRGACKPKEFAKYMQEKHNVKVTNINMVLKRLWERGLIRRTAEGLYTLPKPQDQ